MNWFSFAIHEWRPTAELKVPGRVIAEKGDLSLIRRKNFTPHTTPEVPDFIRALGRKASQYADALVSLDRLGSPEAHEARILFIKVLSRTGSGTLEIKVALKLLHDADACPVDIGSEKRWKMDAAGRFALELLLWLWHARRVPNQYGVWGDIACKLPDFNIGTADIWWRRALGALNDSYREPQEVPQLRALATSQNSRASAMAVRNDIIRKIRDRFQSFARPLGKQTVYNTTTCRV